MVASISLKFKQNKTQNRQRWMFWEERKKEWKIRSFYRSPGRCEWVSEWVVVDSLCDEVLLDARTFAQNFIFPLVTHWRLGPDDFVVRTTEDRRTM